METAMRVIRNSLVVFLSIWLVIAPATARAQQTHVVDQATLDRAVAAQAQQADADRQAIRRMLRRQQVREIAARAGIALTRAETAVATLDGAELQQIATQARAVDTSLAGGQGRVTISTTMIIIGLLALILIIVAVK
jgi:cell division protein FtsL